MYKNNVVFFPIYIKNILTVKYFFLILVKYNLTNFQSFLMKEVLLMKIDNSEEHD